MTSTERNRYQESPFADLTIPAIAWSLAEQTPTEKLAQLYRSDELLDIAVNMLRIGRGSLEFKTADLEASLNKGTGNAYWDDHSAVSWIFGFRERLQHSIPLLEQVPHKVLAKKAAILTEMYTMWINRLLAATLPEDNYLVSAEFTQFCNYATAWNEIWMEVPCAELIDINRFEEVLFTLPKKSPEQRLSDLHRSAELTYGLTVSEAELLLDQTWQRQAGISLFNLEQLPIPKVENSGNNLNIQKIIESLIELTQVEFGITLTEHIKIEGRSSKKSDQQRGLYDELLENYPAYYYAGKKTFVYNIHASADKSTILLLIHESWGHVVTDIYNSLYAQNQAQEKTNSTVLVENLYHRSLPDVHEETLAILLEWTMGGRFTKLLGNTGIDQTRSFFNLYRGWADYAYNYQGQSLAAVSKKLEYVLEADQISLITKNIQLKPGMYLFAYTALPEAVYSNLTAAGYQDSSMISFVKRITTSGTSWKFPALHQAPSEKRLPYFTAGDKNPFRLGEHAEGVHSLDYETMKRILQVRPGQVLEQKDLETWIYWLKMLNGKQDTHIHAQPTSTTAQTGLSRFLNQLEAKTTISIVERAAIDNWYGADVSAPNPSVQIMELHELVYRAVSADFPASLPLQTEMLEYLTTQVQAFYTNKDLKLHQNYPVYVLRTASERALRMGKYIKSIAWLNPTLQPAMRLVTDLETLARAFTTLATETAGPRRTNKQKYAEYTTLYYDNTPEELRTKMGQLLHRFELGTTLIKQQAPDYLDGYINVRALYKWLNVDFFPNISFTQTGHYENPEGVAYSFPAEKISLHIAADLDRETVVQAMTEQEVMNISPAELQRLFYDNLITNIAKILSIQAILHMTTSEEPLQLVTYDFVNTDPSLIASKHSPHFLLDPNRDITNDSHLTVEPAVTFPLSEPAFARIYSQTLAELIHVLLQDQSFEYPHLFDDEAILKQCVERAKATYLWAIQNSRELTEISVDGKTQTVLMHSDSGESFTPEQTEYYLQAYYREILEVLNNLPPDNPIVTLAIQYGLIDDLNRVTNKPLQAIFTDFYTTVSNTVWNHRCELKVVPPLKHLATPILIHESLHALIELAARSADPEKKWASRINYGSQTESLPTFLAWYLTNKSDPVLAAAYMQYICYSALGEISLNYGLDESDPKPSSMARVYTLYREYLTEGQAAYLANLHTKSQRSKPWRLSYVADFERWEEILEHIKKHATDDQVSILFMLTLGMYHPKNILEEIEASEHTFRAAVMDFVALQKKQ